MPGLDIAFYERTGTFRTFERGRSEVLKASSLGNAPAQGLEIISNKVVKFLHTTYGSDVLEPKYGSRAFSITQMSQQHLPKFRLELEKDLSRCTAYIKNSEMSLAAGTEKLSRILLRDIQYNPDVSPPTLHVYLEIITNKSSSALIAINKDIG